TRWLAKRGFDEEMGARPLARVIQEHVKKPIADEILFGALKNGGVVRVRLDPADPDKLAFEFLADEKHPSDKGGVPALVGP
ncbi:MAG TPA: hypothetical protein DDZ68_12675, partial [Parvularcula sp.]|nr:hypothetical protein [Parvularcula sp.]